MRAFVTGASGFIGSAVIDKLRNQGVQVVGVDLVADTRSGIVGGDISKPGDWQYAAKGCELVVHAAAVVSNAFDLESSWNINVLGTKHVADAAQLGGARSFLHISSIRAFSDISYPDGVTEDYPVRTDGNPYVDTKVAGEQVVLQAHAAGRFAVTIVRPGDVYGPGSRPWTIIPVKMIRQNRFLLPARGKGIFSPIYVEDLVEGLLLASKHPRGAGQVFTLTGGESVTCQEFFSHYYRMLHKSGPKCVPTAVALPISQLISLGARLARVPTEINATSTRYLTRTGGYSIDKARSLLNYHPKINLSEGMERTEVWLAANGMLS